jgi:uncharacterized protein YndB with AHSA1/START domain
MTKTTDAISHSVLVPLPQDAAFELFTSRMGDWWPKDSHHISEAPTAEAVLEAHEGGRWYERADDGSECDWGYVRALLPPERIVLAWHLSPEWSFDPDPAKATEVEVTFAAEENQTRVTLEHRGFEVHGEAGAAMRESVSGDGGWPSLMGLYRTAAG